MKNDLQRHRYLAQAERWRRVEELWLRAASRSSFQELRYCLRPGWRVRHSRRRSMQAPPGAPPGEGPAALPAVGVDPAIAPGSASERGMGAFAAGTAPFSTRSTPTLLEPARLPIMLLLAARTISGALTCLGSTSVGSPALVASDTSGPLRKFPINLPKCPSEPRLAISALSSATAASVACGTCCFIACNRFLASSARSSRG